MDYNHKVAYVTGGSSGIGLAVAKELSRCGASVWLIARRKERLEAAIQEVRKECRDTSQIFGMLPLDVSDASQTLPGLAGLIAQSGPPDVVVNSAGVAHPGYFEELPLEVFYEMMAVNYFGTVHVIKAVIPSMIQRRSGLIINISSIAGYLGTFGYTAYGASKFAIRGFSDTLRAEMKPRGIQVSVVFPPDTQTPELEYENQFKPDETRELSGNAKLMLPEQVAHIILTEAARGRQFILPGAMNKMIYHLFRLIGGWGYPLMDFLVADAQKKKARIREGR